MSFVVKQQCVEAANQMKVLADRLGDYIAQGRMYFSPIHVPGDGKWFHIVYVEGDTHVEQEIDSYERDLEIRGDARRIRFERYTVGSSAVLNPLVRDTDMFNRSFPTR